MSLLRTVRCVHCGEKIEVPATGFFRIQCGKCSGINLFRSPLVAKVVTIPPSAPIADTPGLSQKPQSPPEVPAPPSKPVQAEPKTQPEKNANLDITTLKEETPPFPQWNTQMRKAELLKIAMDLKLEVNSKSSKGDIMKALRKASESQSK